MPPRPPPTPPVLTVLCCFAALVAVWVCLAVDQLARAGAGWLFGVPLGAVTIARAHHYQLWAAHGSLAGLGPFSYAMVVLTGTLAVVACALFLGALVALMRAPGWLRGFSLALYAVALMWLPLMLVAASVPGGHGPAADLYRRLGTPQAGRWATAALALLVLGLVAGPVSSRAVATGGRWMRTDGVQFRRRLVRVTVGWPAATAAVALWIGADWAEAPALLVVPFLALWALHLRTR